jgi:hypothetical protein
MTKQVLISSVLSQAGEYATQSATAGGFDRADAHVTRTALKLDETGWSALAAVTRRWLADVERIESSAKRRIERLDEEPFDVGLVIMLFEALPFFRAGQAGEPAPLTQAASSPSRPGAVEHA